MRRLAMLVAVAAAWPITVCADDRIVPERTRVTLVGTSARFELRFAFAVEGPKTAERTEDESSPPRPFGGLTVRSIDLPIGTAITGATLRIGKAAPHRLALAAGAKVDAAFEALQGAGMPRGWAVRIDGIGGYATIQIVAPRDDKVTLDMTLDVPTCYARDGRHLYVPGAWKDLAFAPAAQTLGLDEACGSWRGVEGGWISFPSTQLSRKAAGAARVGILGGRLSVPKHDFARIEIDLASELAPMPRDLYTVIVVDHSRSVSPDERDIQRELVTAYLRAAPHGRVQLVGYARTAQRLLPGWLVASTAHTRIDRELRALPPRNGSNLDEALATAGTLLAGVQGTRRVILLADERLPFRLTGDGTLPDLKGLLPPSTILHALTPRATATTLERYDESWLAQLALATTGMAMHGNTDARGEIDAEMLVRPTTLDGLEITGTNWTAAYYHDGVLGCQLKRQLRAGTSCTWWAEGTPSAGAALTVEGWLWGTKIKRTIRPNSGQSVAVARALMLFGALDPKIFAAVERAAMAVNSTWSLFGSWGSPGGYVDVHGGGGMRFGSIGGGGSRMSGLRFGTVRGGDMHEQLQPQIEAAIRSCKPTSRVSVSVETTLEEIVAVGHVAHGSPSLDDAMRTCILEAIWDVTLVLTAPFEHTRTTITVEVDGPQQAAAPARG